MDLKLERLEKTERNIVLDGIAVGKVRYMDNEWKLSIAHFISAEALKTITGLVADLPEKPTPIHIGDHLIFAGRLGFSSKQKLYKMPVDSIGEISSNDNGFAVIEFAGGYGIQRRITSTDTYADVMSAMKGGVK